MPENNVEQLIIQATQQHRAGDLVAAEAAYQQVLAVNPTHAVALHLLGVINASRGELEQAISLFEAATRSQPGYAEAHYNLGKALQDSDRLLEAVDAYRQAIAARPTYARAFNNLGVVLQKLGRVNEALQSYDAALAAHGAFPAVHFNRGTLLEQLQQLDEAVAAYRIAVHQKPDYADALTNLGNTLQKLGRFDEAIARLQESLALQPKSAIALNALGNALKEIGRVEEALDCYRQAVDVGGGHWAAGNYLYTSHFLPGWDARRIFDEHAGWNERYAKPLAPLPTPHVRISARLKVGFVSPDLREHPVGRFILPLAEKIDRSRFEIAYFSDAIVNDSLAGQIKAVADQWHDTRQLSDEQLADFVRSQKIDVLVDLTMHMEGSRLLTFARKPAPLQMTYLAYCSTTGLTAIDYRLSDPYLDPIGIDESVYSEKTLRLQRTYWCYRPPSDTPEIFDNRRHITVFGCLNNYCKISDATWDAWLELLSRAPRTELLIFCPEGRHRETARDRLRNRGIDADRLLSISRMPRSYYFETFSGIDVVLDPFPYGGGTTTLDGLWAGVPAVSLIGRTAVGRGGASILNNLGQPDWLAANTMEYVAKAVELAERRIDRLALRDQLRASPLMDEKQFVRDFEAAIARAWLDQAGEAV